MHTGLWWKNLSEYHLKDPCVDGRIIIKQIFQKWKLRTWTDRSVSEQGQIVDCCECGNKLSCSIKCGEFLD
jgi:hypothetical protein